MLWSSALALAVLAAFGLREAGTSLVISVPLDAPDAIISLGSHEWERLPAAARLAARHPSAVVLLTQPRVITVDNCHDCGRRAARLARDGVAPTRIHVLPPAGRGTYGEAEAALGFARQKLLRRFLIVTSPYHTRRALHTFRTVFAGTGIRFGVYPATDTSPARPRRWWVEPYDRWYVRYEWLATVYYAFRYRVAPWGSDATSPAAVSYRSSATPVPS